ncbi:MAG: F0F1 ATP synthase subunit delta [Actinomycetaceae bacterium]|nr:F0F1 ATP synthase subunit delta [Actinomycetaceae bacterium]MDU0970452.1 F0F1 ATP synthase subunit delta [Actinomycetaceae bacterium]
MRASSEAALATARQTLAGGVEHDADAAATVARQLFEFSDLVAEHPKLAAALTDPMRSADAHEALATELFGEVAPVTKQVIAAAVRQRWSEPADLAEAAERLGVLAVAYHARATDNVEHLQRELFEIVQTLRDHRELRVTLGRRSDLDLVQRTRLAKQLFAGKVSDDALLLLNRGLAKAQTMPVRMTLMGYCEDIAAIDGALVANVRVATEPTPEQLERLHRVLTAKLGREVLLNVATRPDLVGGMRVSVGSTIYDGTIRSAIEDAEQTLAGKARA